MADKEKGNGVGEAQKDQQGHSHSFYVHEVFLTDESYERFLIDTCAENGMDFIVHPDGYSVRGVYVRDIEGELFDTAYQAVAAGMSQMGMTLPDFEKWSDQKNRQFENEITYFIKSCLEEFSFYSIPNKKMDAYKKAALICENETHQVGIIKDTSFKIVVHPNAFYSGVNTDERIESLTCLYTKRIRAELAMYDIKSYFKTGEMSFKEYKDYRRSVETAEAIKDINEKILNKSLKKTASLNI